jgi:hypothetical protein
VCKRKKDSDARVERERACMVRAMCGGRADVICSGPGIEKQGKAPSTALHAILVVSRCQEAPGVQPPLLRHPCLLAVPVAGRQKREGLRRVRAGWWHAHFLHVNYQEPGGR